MKILTKARKNVEKTQVKCIQREVNSMIWKNMKKSKLVLKSLIEINCQEI